MSYNPAMPKDHHMFDNVFMKSRGLSRVHEIGSVA